MWRTGRHEMPSRRAGQPLVLSVCRIIAGIKFVGVILKRHVRRVLYLRVSINQASDSLRENRSVLGGRGFL